MSSSIHNHMMLHWPMVSQLCLLVWLVIILPWSWTLLIPKNDREGIIHELFILVASPNRGYRRMRKKFKWALDFIQLDFPSRYPFDERGFIPTWNILVEDHV